MELNSKHYLYAEKVNMTSFIIKLISFIPKYFRRERNYLKDKEIISSDIRRNSVHWEKDKTRKRDRIRTGEKKQCSYLGSTLISDGSKTKI